MAWLAVDRNRDEYFFTRKPFKTPFGEKVGVWTSELREDFLETKIHYCKIERGSIFKLLGRELDYDSEPVQI